MCFQFPVLNHYVFIFHLERKRRQKNKLYVHQMGDLVSKKSSAKKKTGLSVLGYASQITPGFCVKGNNKYVFT